MTLLKDNNYKDINVALLSLEADIKNKITGSFDTSAIDKQLAEINSRIDKINAGGGSSSSDEIEDINSKLNSNSIKIRNIEQNIEDIGTQINGIEQKLSEIFSAENEVTDFNTTTNSGIYYWLGSSANKPGTDYGVLLVNKYDSRDGTSNLWINQIAYGTNSKIYFRQNINSTGWTEWKAVAFEGEITATKVANALTVNGKTYDGSRAVDAGVQTVENGGTGQTTAQDAADYFIASLPASDGVPVDTDYFISQEVNGGPFVPAYNRRPISKLWEYIKGKISSVLGLTKDNYGGKADTAGTADSLFYRHGNEINFKGGAQGQCWFNYRNADTGGPSPVATIEYRFCNYSGDTTKSVLMAGSFDGTTAKASSKMVIPIGAPSSLEDGCIWIER